MRETRHLWVGNLPENSREDRIADLFKRYGRVEKVKFLSKRNSNGSQSALVAFVDIRSAQKAHLSVNMLGDKQLQTNYSDPSVAGRQDSPPNSSRGNSSHRSHPLSHRTDNQARPHEGERMHGVVRHRNDTRETTEEKTRNFNKDKRESEAVSPLKSEKKVIKGDNPKQVKKKAKKINVDEPRNKKANKKDRGRSPTVKRKSTGSKKSSKGSSSEEEGTSSSSNSTSRTSSSNSHSSSSSNSSASTGTRSTGESDAEIVVLTGGEQLVTMIIKKLPVRPSVNSLRDGIYHEFKKCGKVKSVLIRGDNNSRHALVLFRTSGEANKAVGHAKTKLLFGAAIEAAIYEGEVSGKELQECGGIIDEFHPRSSRTLFVGNLDKTVGYSDIQNIFVRFGEIVAIEIKKQNNIPQYAFLQYTDVASVVKAIQKMDGERLGKNTLKLGFGKTVLSSCIWVEGVTDSFTEHYLASCFQKYGNVERVVIDRNRGQALVFYLKYEYAQQALNNMRGRKMNGSRLKLDFASQELIELFLSHMQSSGQSVTTFDSIRHLLLPAPSSSGAPPSLPQSNNSRSSRSSSSHPYPNEPYYDEGHRYPPAPPNFDMRGPSPSRGDWRSWEDRGRSRPVYQGVSPRGRRFDDERHERDYYHREDDYYPERPPPSGYDLEHRSREFTRDHSRDYGPPSRGYNEDYHRGVKPGRERRDRDSLYHPRSVHSPMSRARRSRSFSPRGGAPGSRGREYMKGESRGREYPDHPSRGRTPPKSPGSRESRGSGSEAWGSRKIRGDKYSSPASHPSPVCHASPGVSHSKHEERRAESREMKNASPPKSSKIKSGPGKHDAWPQGKGRDVKEEGWSPTMDYNRSRSETPTRDENLDSIGEIIIKQPVSSKVARSIKQEVTDERNPVSRRGSRTSSCHSERELEVVQRELKSSKKEARAHKRSHLLQRVHSSSASEMSSDGQKHSKHSKVSKKVMDNKSQVHVLRQQPQTSDSDSDHRFKSQKNPQEMEVDSKSTLRRKSTDSNRSLGLIKREFSPSNSDHKHGKSQQEKSSDSLHHKTHEKMRKHSKHPEEDAERERSTSSHKKRRHSERSREQPSDSDQSSSPSRKERKTSESSKLYHHGNNEEERSTRRSRKTSLKHEAPMSIASQCFQDEVEDNALEQEVEDREPSSRFPQRHISQEEVVVADEVEEKDAASDIDEGGAEEDEKSTIRRSSSDQQISHISKVSQPFVNSYNPYLMKPTSVRRQLSHECKTTKEKIESETVPGIKKESTSNLSKLEQEKQRLEGLLCKLDSEQNLEVDEANAVADVYLENVENKLKSKNRKVKKVPSSSETQRIPPVEESSLEVAADLMDVPEFEIEEEEQTYEEVDEDVAEEAVSVDQHPEEISPGEQVSVPKDVDARQGYRKQMEEQRREVQREKEVHCLIRKQKKEDEKHTKRIEKLRGPSQGIVSSIDEEVVNDEEDSSQSLDKNKVEEDTAMKKNGEEDLLTNENSSSKTSPTFKESSNLNSDNKATAVAEIRSTLSVKQEESKFVSPSTKPETKSLKPNRQESTEVAPQKTTKSPSLTQKLDDLMKMVQNKTPVSNSPYTPKSTSSVGKSSQASQKSGSSRNNSPSPSNGRRQQLPTRREQPHPHQHMQARKTSSSSSGRHNSHHNKTPASEKKRKQDHHRHYKRTDVRKPVKVKPLTALTVALNASSSEPLGKKELEILKSELETMRSQLNLEVSSYLLSPASDEDQPIASVSPILKSPNADPMLTPDASSVDSTRSSHRISPSLTSLTERLKLYGRVKKKVKEGGSNEESGRRGEKGIVSGDQEFKTTRPIRSSIFDQDLARLSHLQNQDPVPKDPTTPATPLFSSFIDPNDLIFSNNKPLFSAYAEKTGLLEPQCANYLVNNNNTAGVKPTGVKTAPKNVPPLSSDISLPATAESTIVQEAGKVAEPRPKDESLAAENLDQVDTTPVCPKDVTTSTNDEIPSLTDVQTNNADVKISNIGSADKVLDENTTNVEKSNNVMLESQTSGGELVAEEKISKNEELLPGEDSKVGSVVAVEPNLVEESMDTSSPCSFLDVDLEVSETTVKEEVVEERKSLDEFANKDEIGVVGPEYVIPAPEVVLTEEVGDLDDPYKKHDLVEPEGGSFEVETVKHPDLFAEEHIETVEVAAHEQEIVSSEVADVDDEDHNGASAEKPLENVKNEMDNRNGGLLEKADIVTEVKPSIINKDIISVNMTSALGIQTSQQAEDIQTNFAQEYFESNLSENLNKSHKLIIEENVELPEDNELVIEHPEETQKVTQSKDTESHFLVQSKKTSVHVLEVDTKKENTEVEKASGAKKGNLVEKISGIVEESVVMKEKQLKTEKDENKSESKLKKLHKKSSQKEGKYSDKHSVTKLSDKINKSASESGKSSSKLSFHRKHDKPDKLKTLPSKTLSSKENFKSKTADSKDDSKSSKEEVKKEHSQLSKMTHDSKSIKQESKPFKSTQDPKFLSKLNEGKPEKKVHPEKSSQQTKSTKSSHESKISTEKHHSHSEKKSKDSSVAKSDKTNTEKPPQDLKLLKKASSLSQKFEKRVQESKPKSRDSSFEKSKSVDETSKSKHPEKKKMKEEEKRKLVSKKHKLDDGSKEKQSRLEHKTSDVKSKKKDKSSKHSDSKKESNQHHRDAGKIKSSKHHKTSQESDQPLKKKPRLDEKASKKVVKKSESKSHLVYTDSEDSDGANFTASKKPGNRNADSTGEKPVPKKEPQKFPERKVVSDESGSSDEYDNFISLMNKSVQSKKMIYSSDESSSESDHSPPPPPKPKIEAKPKKPHLVDSDHSDKSTTKKKYSKTSSSLSESRKDVKSTKDSESKSKSKGLKTEKKSLSKPKDSHSGSKHSKVPSHVSDSEKNLKKKSKPDTKPPKYFGSSDNSSSVEDSYYEEKHKGAVREPSATKPSKQKEQNPDQVDRKSSSSSLESLDYPPPSPASTNLTTQTIKAETLVSTDYVDFTSFRAGDKEKSKENKDSSSKTFSKPANLIYTSSSDSDSSFDDVPAKSKFTTHHDDKIKEFTSSSGSDSDDFDKLLVISAPPKKEIKTPATDEKHHKDETKKHVESKVKQHSDKTVKKDLGSGKHLKQHDTKHVALKTSTSHHKVEKKHKSSPDIKTSKHQILGKDGSKQTKELPFKHLPIKDTIVKKTSSLLKEHSSKHSVTTKPEGSKHVVQGKDSKHPISKDPLKHKKDSSSKHISKDSSANMEGKKQKQVQKSHDDKMTPKLHSEVTKSDETKKHSDKHRMDKARKLKKLHKQPHDSKESGKSKDSKHSNIGSEKSKHSDERHKQQIGFKSKHKDAERKISKDSLSVKQSVESQKAKSPLHSENKHKKLHHKPKQPSSIEKMKSSEPEPIKSNQSSGSGGKPEMKKQTGFRSGKPVSRSKPSSDIPKKHSPVVKKQETLDSDSNPPGKSFFDSDSSDSDESTIETNEPKEFTKQEDLGQEKPLEPFKKLHASPVRQKSLFSPPRSKDEESDPSADLKDVFPPKQNKSDQESASKHHHGDRETGNKKKKNIQKIQDSAKSKPDLVLSFERIQAEKKSQQEERERQKKLSQQRDEEAVRSIMSGDETSDSMYLTDTSCKSDLVDSKLDLSSTSITEPPAFVKQEVVVKKTFPPQERKPSQSDTSVSSSSDAAKPVSEPLSTAEEMELAAAVSSIEGSLNWYGDFGEEKEEVPPPFQPSSSFEAPPKVEPPPPKIPAKVNVEDDKGSNEAALAASALMMEGDVFDPDPKPFPLFEESEKNISPWRRNRSQEKKKRSDVPPVAGLTSPPPKPAETKTNPGLTSPNNHKSPNTTTQDIVEKSPLKTGSFETPTIDKKVTTSPWSLAVLQYPQPNATKHPHKEQQLKKQPSLKDSAWGESGPVEPLILPTIKPDEQSPFIQTSVGAESQSSVDVKDVKDVPARPFVPVASPARKEFPKPEVVTDFKPKDTVPLATNPPFSSKPRKRSRDLQQSSVIDPPGGARLHASPRSYGHHLPASISLPAGSRTNQAHNDPIPLLSNLPPHHTSPPLHPPNVSQSPQRLVFFQPPFVQDINKQHAKQPTEVSPVSGAFKLPQTQPFVVPGPDLSPGPNFPHFSKLPTPTSSPLSLRNPFFPTSLQSSVVSTSTNPSQHQLIYSQKGVESYQVPPHHHMSQNAAHRSHSVAQRSPTVASVPPRNMPPNAPHMPPTGQHVQQNMPHVAPVTPHRPPNGGHAQMPPTRIPNYPQSPAATSPSRPPIISPKLPSPTAASMRMTQPIASPSSRMQIPVSIPLYSPPHSHPSQQTPSPQHSKPAMPATTTKQQQQQQQQQQQHQHQQQQLQQQQPSHFQPASRFQIPMFSQNPMAFPTSAGLPVEPKKTTASQSPTVTEAQKISHPMSPYNPQMFYPGIVPYGMPFPFQRYLPRPHTPSLIPMHQQRSQPTDPHMMAGQPRGHGLPGQQSGAGHPLPGVAPLTHLLHRQPPPGHQPHMGEVIPMTQPQTSIPKSPQKQQFFHPHFKNDVPGIPKPAQTPPRAAPSPKPTPPLHQLPRQPPPRHSHPSQDHRSVVSLTSEASLDMIDQHFRKSGIPPVSINPTQHSSAPSGGQHQTSIGQPRPGYSAFPQHSYRPEIAHLAHQAMSHMPHPFQRNPDQNYPQNTTPNRNQAHHIPPSNSPQRYPPAAPSISSRLTPRHSTPPLSHPHHNPQPVPPQNPPEHETSQEPASLEELFKRYPVIWQGKLALKTESAAVQLHYVSGNIQLGQTGLPKHADTADPGGLAVLRIIQRMRINQQQLEGISKRMMVDNDFCMLLALPCGRDKEDVARHTSALSTGFIEYLQQKQVAGIVNTEGVLVTTQQRTSFVVHIFPPCEFCTTNLQQRAPDLLTNVGDIHHLLIVITAA